jgi:uncharacterized protein (TIGR02145 family)
MSIQKWYGIFALPILFLSYNLFSQIVVQGTVTDNGGEYLGSGAEPVVNALVTLTDQSEPSRMFSDYTNEQGQYAIEIIQTGLKEYASLSPGGFRLRQNYPNPFNPSTVIVYEITRPCKVRINVYNVSGENVRTLIDGYESGSGRVIWEATDDRGRTVPAGLYICSMYAEGKRFNRKMLLMDGHCGPSATEITFSNNLVNSGKSVLNKQISSFYTLKINGEDITPYEEVLEIAGNMTLDATVARTVTDVDENTYRTVKIGDQWWTAENLKVTHYRNGDPILNVTDYAGWPALSTGAYCAYDNNETIAETYGYLYNWYAVDDPRQIPAVGWHVPTDEEWKELEIALGMSPIEADATLLRGTDVGGKLKEEGTVHWISPNTGATNESGFTALPGGERNLTGFFSYTLGYDARFWSSSAFDGNSAWNRFLHCYFSEISRVYDSKRLGFSVRLLRDAEGVYLSIDPGILNLGSSENSACFSISSNTNWTVSEDADWLSVSDLSGSGNGMITVTADDNLSAAARSATLTVIGSGAGSRTVTVRQRGSVSYETGTMTDQDGNVYKTVKIGDQWWMAENLKVTHYLNGDPVPNISDDMKWADLAEGAYRAYGNSEVVAEIYGYLYNWYAVNDSRNISPVGWHVPMDDEWKALEMFLGMSQSEADMAEYRGTDEGGKLKETGTLHWHSPNAGCYKREWVYCTSGRFPG